MGDTRRSLRKTVDIVGRIDNALGQAGRVAITGSNAGFRIANTGAGIDRRTTGRP